VSVPDPWTASSLVLDGGLATQLEAQGHDLSDALWSARLLRDAPAQIVAAHRAYLRAGAQVATTASYQASLQGFVAAGMTQRQAAALISSSVALAREAVQAEGVTALVAASVGPYGAVLAGGQEYTGDYDLGDETATVAALRRFHRPRLQLLAEAGPDLLAVETLPRLAEVEAVLAELDVLGLPAWVSLSTTGTTTRRGEPAADAFAMAAAVSAVVAVGVNCCDPADLPAVLPLAAATGARVVAYPNSGETWDAAARTWVGRPDLDPETVTSWWDAGGRWLGGCCRVGPGAVAQVAAVVAAHR